MGWVSEISSRYRGNQSLRWVLRSLRRPAAKIGFVSSLTSCAPSNTDRSPSDSELAFVDACLFAGRPLRFLGLDQIIFRLPVPIGAVLHMSAKIVTSTKPRSADEIGESLAKTSAGNAKIHVVVEAEVEDVASGVSHLRSGLGGFAVAD